MADSGVDDDRLAPRQPPLLHLSAGGDGAPHDPDRARHGGRQHPRRQPARRRRRRPRARRDAAVGAHRQVGDACNATVLEHGLVEAFGWLRRKGAQVVNVSAHRPSPRTRSSNRCARCSSRVRWSWPRSATAATSRAARFPASQPGVLGVGALAPGSSTQVWQESTRGPRSISSRRRRASRCSHRASSRDDLRVRRSRRRGTSFAAPLVTAAAAMVWATHRDWTAAEVANALVRSATPLARGGCRAATGATASST